MPEMKTVAHTSIVELMVAAAVLLLIGRWLCAWLLRLRGRP
jgi:hypothetical protein